MTTPITAYVVADLPDAESTKKSKEYRAIREKVQSYENNEKNCIPYVSYNTN